MPNLNPNSTNYVHTHEPNTNDLVQAMTYDPYGAPVLRIDDTTKQHTSKNRVKVSTQEITDFVSYINGKHADIFDEKIVGTASATLDVYQGMVKLEVGGNAGDSVTRQTRRIQRYIPGRQNEVSMSVRFGNPVTGIRRRFGLFSDFNGAFFEDGGDGTYYVCTRRNTASGVVDTRVAREDWNYDKMDGTGPSGITVDPAAIQLAVIEYEWYGAGQVEFKFVIDNNSFPVHRFNHANRQETTWASAAALPVRVELTNVAGTPGTHTFYHGSHSFATEARTEILGRQLSISTPVTGKTLTTANTFYPVVAIRLKASALDSVVIPDVFSGATLDNTSIFVKVLEGVTVTGGTWVDYGPDSAVEYNLTGTSFTGGNTIETVFVSSGNMGQQYQFADRSLTQLQRSTTTTLGDTPVTFLVAIAALNANKAGWASLGWIEVR